MTVSNTVGTKIDFSERELYLLLRAVDEAARREGPGSDTTPRGNKLWALCQKLSAVGASFTFPKSKAFG